MKIPEIEYLISEAIDRKPKATNAPMNLYIYDGKLICGARVVMPIGAVFVIHVSPDQLQNGFSDSEWKLVVEKIQELVGTGGLAVNTPAEAMNIKQNKLQGQISTNNSKFNDRRSEQRLPYCYPVWFAKDPDKPFKDFKKTFSQGRMVDVSSCGMAFTCNAYENRLSPGIKLTSRFSVPRVNPDNSLDTISFNRIGHICRIERINSVLDRVAVSFNESLPFRPAEQVYG